MKKQGFTLIELLVVIAIIAILAAILFPVFAKVREKARQTSCLSNEKQLGLAFQQYVQDYDEKYPCGLYAGSNYGTGWAGQIYSYVKSTAMFACPDDSTSHTSPGVVVSYGYNFNVANPPHAEAEFVSDSKSVLVFEISGNTGNITDPQETGPYHSACGNGVAGLGTFTFATGYLSGYGSSPGYTASDGSSFPISTGRHTDGANYLLCDGHAKWLKGSLVSSGYDNGGSTTDASKNCANGSYCVAAGPDFSGNSLATGGPFAATFSTK